MFLPTGKGSHIHSMHTHTIKPERTYQQSKINQNHRPRVLMRGPGPADEGRGCADCEEKGIAEPAGAGVAAAGWKTNEKSISENPKPTRKTLQTDTTHAKLTFNSVLKLRNKAHVSKTPSERTSRAYNSVMTSSVDQT